MTRGLRQSARSELAPFVSPLAASGNLPWSVQVRIKLATDVPADGAAA